MGHALCHKGLDQIKHSLNKNSKAKLCIELIQVAIYGTNYCFLRSVSFEITTISQTSR